MIRRVELDDARTISHPLLILLRASGESPEIADIPIASTTLSIVTVSLAGTEILTHVFMSLGQDFGELPIVYRPSELMTAGWFLSGTSKLLPTKSENNSNNMPLPTIIPKSSIPQRAANLPTAFLISFTVCVSL